MSWYTLNRRQHFIPLLFLCLISPCRYSVMYEMHCRCIVRPITFINRVSILARTDLTLTKSYAQKSLMGGACLLMFLFQIIVKYADRMIGWLNQGTAHLINQVTIILICVIGKYLKLMWALPGRKKIAKKVKKLES